MSATLKAALIGGIAGAVMAVGSVAVAGTGIGGVFNLGADNTVNGQTQLRGNIGGNSQLRVVNQEGTNGAIGVLGVHSAEAGRGAGVQGETASAAFDATAILGRVTSASAGGDSAAVKALNLGDGYGVWADGRVGVFGQGSDYGVAGTTPPGTGWGVLGQAGSDGSGVRGIGGQRRLFSSSVANGTGILGTVTGGGHGVRGEAGVLGSGVRGLGGNGGSFSSTVANGTGVLGTVTGAGHGVRGEAASGGTGVRGIGGSGYGSRPQTRTARAFWGR